MNIVGFLRRHGAAVVLLGSFSGCSSVVFYPMYVHTIGNAQRTTCQSQLKSIMVACFQYQDDYDGRYPPLSQEGKGWSQILQERAPTLNFSCRAGYKPSFSPSSDYFFNAQLASQRSSTLKDPSYTIAVGDGPDNGPTNSHYWELPNDGENENSPLQRHYGLANYAFADGHIKSLSPGRLNESWEDYDDHKWRHYKLSPSESAATKNPKQPQLYKGPT